MTPEENQLLEQIKRSRASVRAVGDYVRLVKDGSEWRALCPFHADKNPSLKIFVHEGVYLYKCFGCGASGNLVQFVENITSCSFKEALETVKQKLGSGQWDDVKKKSSNFAPIAPPEKKRTFTLAQHAKYEVALADSLAGLEFLRARGIEHSTAQRLHLGYVQDISKFCPKYAAMKKEIAAQGWISIPYIKNDTVILVQYRSIVARERCRFPGMSTTIFNGDTVEGISPVFVCEGAFDSLVLEQAGFRSVAMYNASQGLSPEDKDIIMNADSVILAVDTDEAGQACAAKLQAELGEKTLTIRWPEKDANDTLLKTCGGDKAKFKELVDGLVSAAKETPMPSVHSLQEAMLHSGRTDLTNHPDRLKFPWPAVDKMAILLPGSVTYVSATDTKMGKEQPVDCLVATPTGFVAIGSLRVGNFVIGSDGQPTEVLGVYPQGIKPSYRVSFSDDTSTRCGEEHLWNVRNNEDKSKKRPWKTVTLSKIKADCVRLGGFKSKTHGFRWHTPVVKPVEFSGGETQEIDPYLMGALLGDGGFTQSQVTFTSEDVEMVENIRYILPDGVELNRRKNPDIQYVFKKDGTVKGHVNPLNAALRKLNLFGIGSEGKFIPDIYKYASVEDRLELLRGLLDTDGSVNVHNSVTYYTMSRRLANDTVFLVRSLGGTTRAIPQEREDGRPILYILHVCLPPGMVPFHLDRKRRSYKPVRKYEPDRAVVGIDEDGIAEMVCIQVAAKDGLYVTDDFVVTHNTVWTTQSTLYQAMIWKERVISWQCELTVPEFTEIAAAHILHKSRNHLTKEDYAEASKRLAGTVYYVGHNPMMTEIEPVLDLLEAAIRRLSPTVVVLDHLHHLCENAKDTIKAQGAAMVRIKSLAGTYGVKFIVVGQPRKADQNTKGKSRHVSDIRGAAAIGQSTDAMFSLHREYIKSREEDNPADDVFEPKTEVHLQGVRAKGDGKASAFLLYLGDCATFVPISLDKPPEDKLF